MAPFPFFWEIDFRKNLPGRMSNFLPPRGDDGNLGEIFVWGRDIQYFDLEWIFPAILTPYILKLFLNKMRYSDFREKSTKIVKRHRDIKPVGI